MSAGAFLLPGFPQAAPLAGLGGGLLIGLAAAVLLLGAGRIAGVSGLAAQAFGLAPARLGRGAALAFILGLPAGAWLMAMLLGPPDARFMAPGAIALAGLLVGIGTRLGSGCTSGHGVCGLSRLAPRSLVATASFLVAGMATVAAMNALGVGFPG